MKLKFLVAAAAFAMVGGAHAATDLGVITDTASFSGTAASETFTFTLTSDVVDAYAGVTATFGKKSGYDITSVFFGSTQILPSASTPTFDNYVIFSGALAAGNYSFTVNGTPKSAGASFSGTIEVTPVPEPESLALAVAGLGVAGFVARRRKSA
jgi:hypothetical protein